MPPAENQWVGWRPNTIPPEFRYHPLTGVFRNMHRRCQCHPNYAGRGITVCDRWFNFANFLSDMGERPEGLTLDRIDNDGNYEPSNCRWATHSQQMSNRRSWSCTEDRPSEPRVPLKGELLSVEEASKRSGLKEQTIWSRIYRGWEAERLLDPLKPRGRHKKRLD